jgi:uncharacterized membrane protein YbhN (UPF0104 family)
MNPPAPAIRTTDVRQRVLAWVRLLGGLSILGLLVWRLGTNGFVDGLRLVNPGILLAAAGIGLLTTLLSAWRWCLVARGLGISLRLSTATADCYRAQFLNVALPGGIAGDVHRAVRHGRDVGDLGLGVRAVVLERSAGQLVVVVAGLGLLLALPTPWLSPSRLVSAPPAIAAGLAVAVLLAVVLVVSRLLPRWGRSVRRTVTLARQGLLDRRVWPGIVLASTVVLAGYVATFLVAARAAGATAPTVQLLPLLVLALLAMMIPMNVGGWGPREGVLAWAFGAAGLGAAQGLTVAVVYGLSVFAASLPGAGVLAIRWLRSRRRTAPVPPPVVVEPAFRPEPALVGASSGG